MQLAFGAIVIAEDAAVFVEPVIEATGVLLKAVLHLGEQAAAIRILRRNAVDAKQIAMRRQNPRPSSNHFE